MDLYDMDLLRSSRLLITSQKCLAVFSLTR